MMKIIGLAVLVLVMSWGRVAFAADNISADELKLTAEQNQRLIEMKNNLQAEIEPIWEEIESGKQRITEIEKRYFSEFWNILTEEQKQEFAKLNGGK